MDDIDVRDLVREEDLEVFLSFAIVMHGSIASFVVIRDAIEEILNDKEGQYVVHNTGSAERLYVVKEHEYELIKEIKRKQ